MDQPTTLTQLVEALTALPDLDPVERARRCAALQDPAKTVLAGVRADAMREATDRQRPGWVSQGQLAVDLGVSLSAVTKVLGRGRPRPAPSRDQLEQ